MTASPRGISDTEGFTLVEVLVALAILGLALAMLTSSITDSLARVERIETENQAAALADGVLAELGQGIGLRNGITQGQAQNLRWILTVAPVPGGSKIVPLDQVDLTIDDTANKKTIGHWQTLRVAPVPPGA